MNVDVLAHAVPTSPEPLLSLFPSIVNFDPLFFFLPFKKELIHFFDHALRHAGS